MNAQVQQFISNLVAEFQLDEAELNKMWNSVDTPVTTKCSHTFSKGTKDGKKCGKAVKKGSDLCAAHSKSSEKKMVKVSFSCNHTFNKGVKKGKRCSVKVAMENGRCSKHIIPDENDNKKISLKKWEEILFSQIPEILVKYYKDDKDYLEDAKLTRATANNVAAWILIKYETYFVHEDPANYFNGMVDFHEQMRGALLNSDCHPIDKMADYFDDDANVPDKRDVYEYEMYNEGMAEYKWAQENLPKPKKIYGSK